MVDSIKEEPEIKYKKSRLKSQKSYKIKTKYIHPKMMKKKGSKIDFTSQVKENKPFLKRMKKSGTQSLLIGKNNNFFKHTKKHGYLIDRINKSWFISGQGHQQKELIDHKEIQNGT